MLYKLFLNHANTAHTHTSYVFVTTICNKISLVTEIGKGIKKMLS